MVMRRENGGTGVEVRDVPFAIYLVSQRISGTVRITFDVCDGSPVFRFTDWERVDELRAFYELNGLNSFCARYHQAHRELELAVSVAAVAGDHEEAELE